MTAEKKARQEMEELRQQLKKMQEAERRDRRKLAEDEALRKIKKMEETIAELQKSLASQKQVCVCLGVGGGGWVGVTSLCVVW